MASPEPRWPGLAVAWPDRPPAASGERGRSARLLVAHPVAWPDRARWTGPLGAAVRRDLRREPLVRPPSSVGAAAGPRAGRCRPTTHMRPSPRPRVSLQLARAAMAGIAGVGKNLRRRFAGIQVRLRLGRSRRPKRKADQSGHDPAKPRHHDLLATARPSPALAGRRSLPQILGRKEDATALPCSTPGFSPAIFSKRVAVPTEF